MSSSSTSSHNSSPASAADLTASTGFTEVSTRESSLPVLSVFDRLALGSPLSKIGGAGVESSVDHFLGLLEFKNLNKDICFYPKSPVPDGRPRVILASGFMNGLYHAIAEYCKNPTQRFSLKIFSLLAPEKQKNEALLLFFEKLLGLASWSQEEVKEDLHTLIHSWRQIWPKYFARGAHSAKTKKELEEHLKKLGINIVDDFHAAVTNALSFMKELTLSLKAINSIINGIELIHVNGTSGRLKMIFESPEEMSNCQIIGVALGNWPHAEILSMTHQQLSQGFLFEEVIYSAPVYVEAAFSLLEFEGLPVSSLGWVTYSYGAVLSELNSKRFLLKNSEMFCSVLISEKGLPNGCLLSSSQAYREQEAREKWWTQHELARKSLGAGVDRLDRLDRENFLRAAKFQCSFAFENLEFFKESLVLSPRNSALRLSDLKGFISHEILYSSPSSLHDAPGLPSFEDGSYGDRLKEFLKIIMGLMLENRGISSPFNFSLKSFLSKVDPDLAHLHDPLRDPLREPRGDAAAGSFFSFLKLEEPFTLGFFEIVALVRVFVMLGVKMSIRAYWDKHEMESFIQNVIEDLTDVLKAKYPDELGVQEGFQANVNSLMDLYLTVRRSSTYPENFQRRMALDCFNQVIFDAHKIVQWTRISSDGEKTEELNRDFIDRQLQSQVRLMHERIFIGVLDQLGDYAAIFVDFCNFLRLRLDPLGSESPWKCERWLPSLYDQWSSGFILKSELPLMFRLADMEKGNLYVSMKKSRFLNYVSVGINDERMVLPGLEHARAFDSVVLIKQYISFDVAYRYFMTRMMSTRLFADKPREARWLMDHVIFKLEAILKEPVHFLKSMSALDFLAEIMTEILCDIFKKNKKVLGPEMIFNHQEQEKIFSIFVQDFSGEAESDFEESPVAGAGSAAAGGDEGSSDRLSGERVRSGGVLRESDDHYLRMLEQFNEAFLESSELTPYSLPEPMQDMRSKESMLMAFPDEGHTGVDLIPSSGLIVGLSTAIQAKKYYPYSHSPLIIVCSNDPAAFERFKLIRECLQGMLMIRASGEAASSGESPDSGLESLRLSFDLEILESCLKRWSDLCHQRYFRERHVSPELIEVLDTQFSLRKALEYFYEHVLLKSGITAIELHELLKGAIFFSRHIFDLQVPKSIRLLTDKTTHQVCDYAIGNAMHWELAKIFAARGRMSFDFSEVRQKFRDLYENMEWFISNYSQSGALSLTVSLGGVAWQPKPEISKQATSKAKSKSKASVAVAHAGVEVFEFLISQRSIMLETEALNGPRDSEKLIRWMRALYQEYYKRTLAAKASPEPREPRMVKKITEKPSVSPPKPIISTSPSSTRTEDKSPSSTSPEFVGGAGAAGAGFGMKSSPVSPASPTLEKTGIKLTAKAKPKELRHSEGVFQEQLKIFEAYSRSLPANRCELDPAFGSYYLRLQELINESLSVIKEQSRRKQAALQKKHSKHASHSIHTANLFEELKKIRDRFFILREKLEELKDRPYPVITRRPPEKHPHQPAVEIEREKVREGSSTDGSSESSALYRISMEIAEGDGDRRDSRHSINSINSLGSWDDHGSSADSADFDRSEPGYPDGIEQLVSTPEAMPFDRLDSPLLAEYMRSTGENPFFQLLVALDPSVWQPAVFGRAEAASPVLQNSKNSRKTMILFPEYSDMWAIESAESPHAVSRVSPPGTVSASGSPALDSRVLSSSGLNPTAKDFVAIKSPERVSGLRVSGGAFGGEFNPERFDYGRLPRPPLKIAFLATAIKKLESLWDGKSGEETHYLADWL